MKTWSGKNAPLPGDEDGDAPYPLDIAVHMGRTRRFGGWGISTEWTVLHHSMLASMLWMKHFGTDGVHHVLMHDMHETYTGDIPSPIKGALARLKPDGKAAVKALEEHLDARIYEALGVERPEPNGIYGSQVRVVDFSCLLVEAKFFGTPGTVGRILLNDWPGLPDSFKESVRACIESSFPRLFSQLVGEANSTSPTYPLHLFDDDGNVIKLG